jgi:hypothetical protein
MSDGLQVLVIEGPAGPVRVDHYPPQVREAIEVITTYLDGFDAGLAAGSRRSGGGGGGNPTAVPDFAGQRDDLHRVAAAAAAAGDAAFGNAAFTSFSACGAVFGIGEPASSARDVLLVWGPGAANRVGQALSGPPGDR